MSDTGKGILETEGLNPIEPVIEGAVNTVPPVIRNDTLDEAPTAINTTSS